MQYCGLNFFKNPQRAFVFMREMDVDAEAHQLAPAEQAAGEALLIVRVGVQPAQQMCIRDSGETVL